MNAAFTLGAIAIITLLLLLFTRRRQRDDRSLSLRPLLAHTALANQLGEAIESGRQLHISLGRASLMGTANPTSIAAVHVLDSLAKDGSVSGSPPLTTVGDGTLLPIAQDSLRRAHDEAGRLREYKPSLAQFVAADTDPYAFAGGVASAIQQNKAGGNVLVGHYGPEIAIVAEAAVRQNVNQVIGTDDPSALAAATAVTDNLLVGEELFAAKAYLDNDPGQLASLQVQDILRTLIAVVILASAIYQLALG
ncbi:MAG: hypothetical protein GY803_26825 [Chloroflexi bacterium]|nr:hypothetical protein [Chloroflexota bacterium]